MLTPLSLLLSEWLRGVPERGQQQQWPLVGQTRYSADLLESSVLTNTLSLVSRLVRKHLTAVLRFGLYSVRVLVTVSLFPKIICRNLTLGLWLLSAEVILGPICAWHSVRLFLARCVCGRCLRDRVTQMSFVTWGGICDVSCCGCSCVSQTFTPDTNFLYDFYFLMPQSFLDIVTFDCVLESAPSEE